MTLRPNSARIPKLGRRGPLQTVYLELILFVVARRCAWESDWSTRCRWSSSSLGIQFHAKLVRQG